LKKHIVGEEQSWRRTELEKFGKEGIRRIEVKDRGKEQR